MNNELRGFSLLKGNKDLKHIHRNDGWFNYFQDGTKELDLRMGGSSFTLGYGNKEVLNGLEESISKVSRCQSNDGYWTDETLEAGKILCDGVWDTYSWALSGTSAVEAAISMNDEYWKHHGLSKSKIISFSFAWHGTSYLTKDMGAPFLLSNHTGRCINIQHPKNRDGEIKAIEQILSMDLSEVGCIVFDSGTWINGLNSWSEKWWQDIRNICDTYHILMITDDVAACWGKLKAYHPYKSVGYNIQPDISAVGKSLTAGYAPHGAAVCNKKVGEVINQKGNWNYNHTWQPSMIGIYLMLNVHKIIERDNLLENAIWIESQLISIFQSMLEKGMIDNYNVNGTFFSVDAKKETPHVGLSSTILKNNLKGCAPLIANNLYFEDLKEYIDGFIV